MAKPVPMMRRFVTRDAVFPDAETAAALGGIFHPDDRNAPAPLGIPGSTYQLQKKRRSRSRVNNAFSVYHAEAGVALLAFVRADPELAARFVAACDKLHTRKTSEDHPGRPPAVARAIYAVAHRREYFTQLAKDALATYLLTPPAGVSGTPDLLRDTRANLVLAAFKRRCVMTYFANYHGDENIMPA